MNIYVTLLKEVKNSKIDYEKIEEVLKQIKEEIEKGNLPSKEDYIRFKEAIQIIEAKHSILREKIKGFQTKKKVNETYSKFT
jgi:phosphoribosylaminoimidazole (AIR) synthetase